MKKKNKTIITILCVSLSLIMIGGIFIGIGYSQGGHFRIHEKRIGVFNIPAWNKEKTTNKTYHYVPSESTTSLEIDVDVASVNIQRGDRFDITTSHIKNSAIQYEENSTIGTLRIKNEIWNSYNDMRVTITVPETLKDLDIKVNAGELHIMNGLALRNLNVEVNAGDVDIENILVETANIDLDLGDFDFEGDFTKSFTYDNNAGDSDISLRKLQSEYDFDIHGNLGNFEIGDQELSAISGDYIQDNKRNRLLKIKVDLGDLSVDFMDMDRDLDMDD